MAADWSLSERVVEFLSTQVGEFESRQPIGHDYIPGIWWTPAGFAYRENDPAGSRVDIPAKYGVVLLDPKRMPPSGEHVMLPNRRFGFVSFQPREVDSASGRRLIDYDGESIVVR